MHDGLPLMVDIFTTDKRSEIMSRIKNRDTAPEIKVRSIIHRMGYRFRLHRKDLPGNPDIVFPKHKKIIFVNGCFWHGHKNCIRSKRPSSNKNFWDQKIDKNITRDKNIRKALNKSGWKVLVIWQCEINDINKLEVKIANFMAK